MALVRGTNANQTLSLKHCILLLAAALSLPCTFPVFGLLLCWPLTELLMASLGKEGPISNFFFLNDVCKRNKRFPLGCPAMAE